MLQGISQDTRLSVSWHWSALRGLGLILCDLRYHCWCAPLPVLHALFTWWPECVQVWAHCVMHEVRAAAGAPQQLKA